LRQLVCFCPATDSIEVFASVFGVEIDIGLRVLRVNPDLPQNSTVNCAHEFLTKDVKAMGFERKMC
jgi:hypothetical protein